MIKRSFNDTFIINKNVTKDHTYIVNGLAIFFRSWQHICGKNTSKHSFNQYLAHDKDGSALFLSPIGWTLPLLITHWMDAPSSYHPLDERSLFLSPIGWTLPLLITHWMDAPSSYRPLTPRKYNSGFPQAKTKLWT